MQIKKSHIRAAMLLEVAFSMFINLAFFLGAMEFGWYCYSRQALVGAVREAARTDIPRNIELTLQNYLVGMDFPDDFIDAISIDINQINLSNPGPSKIQQVTATIPLSKVLLFGGVPSRLLPSDSALTTLSVSAFERDTNVKGNGNNN